MRCGRYRLVHHTSALARSRNRDRLRVTDTHPPTHLRIKAVESLPASEAVISLSATQEAAIRAELARDYDRISTQIDDALGFANW